MPKVDLSSLSATELEELIAEAAKLRMTVQPSVGAEPPDNSEGVNDPAWRSFMGSKVHMVALRER